MNADPAPASGTAALELLARVRAKLDMSDPDFACHAAHLDSVLSGIATYERASGLSRRGTTAWKLAVIDRRNALIVSYAAEFHSGQEPDIQSQAMAIEIKLYEDRHWRQDQACDRVPGNVIANPRGSLFRIFKAADGNVPRSKKQIRRIVKAGHRSPV